MKKEEKQKNKDKSKKGFWRNILTGLKALGFSIVGVTFSVILLTAILSFAVYFSYAQGFKGAKARVNTTQTVFYDKEGEVIYESYGTRAPKELPISDIPEVVRNATIASEDANFYSHGAIEPKGLIRAALVNVKESNKLGLYKLTDLFDEKNYSQGGSTITQQLVKNIYLTDERSFERKLKEVAYSFELEKNLSKDQILERYLNNVYYGEQALGIQNAAEIFFDKEAKELDLSEASMLAGITVAPTRLSPVNGDFDEAKKRQEYVLSKMYHLGMIDFDQAKEAANKPLYFSNQSNHYVLRAPYFVEYIKQQLANKMGQEALDAGGFSVHTTLDLKKQTEAEEIAKKYMEKFAARKVTNTAIVVLDNKTQEIAAMVGGADWEKSKVNVATAPRQPGSSFKPIVYTAGLLSNYTAATVLADTSVNFGGTPPYRPKNYDGSFHGNVTVRTALANSLNIPAVEMAALAGTDKVVETAKSMGISTLEDSKRYGLSIGLGSGEVKLLELARAYSVLAREGQLGEFVGISKVVDNEGSTIYEQPKVKNQAIDPKVAYIMSNILSDNNARKMIFGANSPLYLKERKVAAKTGTTDNYADSWTMGFTPQFTVGVWMGNNDHSVMKTVSGIEGAAYIWNEVIKAVHVGLPAEEFLKPEGLEEQWIDPKKGTLAKVQRNPYALEYFVPGTAPTATVDLSYLNRFKSVVAKKSVPKN